YEGMPGQADYRVVKYEHYVVRLEQKPILPPPATVEGLPTSELLARADIDARRGRLANLFAAILVYFIYSNVLGLAQTLMRRGQTPVALGLWWVHLIMLAIDV